MTALLSPSPAPGAVRPDWLKIKDASTQTGLSRTFLYKLMREGRIKSSLVRGRGQVSGIRLISADSLINYIEKSVDVDPAKELKLTVKK